MRTSALGLILSVVTVPLYAADLYLNYDFPEPACQALNASTADPDRLYTACGGNLYRSDNRGRNWQPAGSFGEIVDLEIDYQRPLTVYVADTMGIHQSFDGGQRWTQLLAAPEEKLIAVSPGDPDTVYVLVRGDPAQIHRSRDGGNTWDVIEPRYSGQRRLSAMTDMIVTRHDPDSLFGAIPQPPLSSGAAVGELVFSAASAGEDWSSVVRVPGPARLATAPEVSKTTEYYAVFDDLSVRGPGGLSRIETDAQYRPDGPGPILDLNAVTGTLYVQSDNGLYRVLPDFPAQWWIPELSGQGVTITPKADGIWGYWTHYDASGQPSWLLFLGKPIDGRLTTSLYRYTGPPLDQPWDIEAVESEAVGSVTVTFLDRAHVDFEYVVDGVAGRLELVPF